MKRIFLSLSSLLLLMMFIVFAGGQASAADTNYDNPQEVSQALNAILEERNISKYEELDRVPALRQYDELALKAFAEAEKAVNVPPPFAGKQGYVMFPYGAITPRIICRPYRVSDIALEPGEEILGIHAGDTVRWLFAPSVSMQGNLKVSHIIVKPSMPNISTNLMVHTDRRAYQLNLISTEKEAYTPGIAFTYPNTDLNATFGAYQAQATISQKINDNSPVNRTVDPNLNNIYTGYQIVSKNTVDWRPLAVFDDGVKTYIRMPSQISEAPALYISLDGRATLVNYRVKESYYIVDRLFDRAYLQVAKKQVVIKRLQSLAKTNQSIQSIAKQEAMERTNDK